MGTLSVVMSYVLFGVDSVVYDCAERLSGCPCAAGVFTVAMLLMGVSLYACVESLCEEGQLRVVERFVLSLRMWVLRGRLVILVRLCLLILR